MKYLLMIYTSEKAWDALPAAEQERTIGEHLAFAEDLQRSGRFLAGEALQPVATATSVRVQRGKVVTTDGPFAETKEQLGGFILIRSRNLREAVKLGAGIPLAKLGRIEVRPIYDIPVR